MKALKFLMVSIFFSAHAAIAEEYFSAESIYKTAKTLERTDPSRAVALYNSSAKGGFLPAQLLVGGMHRSGIAGVEKNCKKSIYWYEKAAEQGSTEAEYELASIYSDNEDRCYSPSKAVPIYMEAAKGGNGQAQQDLALLYINGVGVNKDLVTAYAWLSAAMKSGVYESSLRLMDLIETKMSTPEIEKAKLLEKSLILNK